MKNFSSSIQRRKRGTRTEYIARLTYYAAKRLVSLQSERYPSLEQHLYLAV